MVGISPLYFVYRIFLKTGYFFSTTIKKLTLGKFTDIFLPRGDVAGYNFIFCSFHSFLLTLTFLLLFIINVYSRLGCFIWDFHAKGSRSNYKNLLLCYTLKNHHRFRIKGNYNSISYFKKSRNKLRDLLSWQSEHWWRQPRDTKNGETSCLELNNIAKLSIHKAVYRFNAIITKCPRIHKVFVTESATNNPKIYMEPQSL